MNLNTSHQHVELLKVELKALWLLVFESLRYTVYLKTV